MMGIGQVDVTAFHAQFREVNLAIEKRAWDATQPTTSSLSGSSLQEEIGW